MRSLEKSEQLFHLSQETLAGGVSSTLRNVMKPVPLYLEKGKGSRVWDVDQNEYIDYIMGYGPLILGHSNSELLEEVSRATLNGQQFGMQHKAEIEMSRMIVNQVPCAEKVAFSGSGTEAVMLALRLARAFTGKQKIVRFEGHYHGWYDGIYTSFPATVSGGSDSIAATQGQSEQALKDILIVPWNDAQKLEAVMKEHGHEIAAIITEPVLCNSGCIYPVEGYMELIRRLTTEHHALFILDEVITGCRVAAGGSQERLGILPDLTTMGKAIAGGYALSLVAGRRDVMDLISSGKVAHLGTLNGNMVALSAGVATLNILNRNDGEVFKRMESVSDALVEGLGKLMDAKGLPHLINRIGSVFHLMFTELKEVQQYPQFLTRDVAQYTAFTEAALQEGVLLRPSGLWYTSAAHSMEDVEETLRRLEKAINRI
ncbi:aspartate aminotransferase family protein [Paenibacillus nasutitermitis]|uniref:Glutamate-1-semialdehyde-2,1-aminomutase n=1 Tax=Paenibacillus nasutitermitis TaxID=1652958 RepID=A0A917E2P4_9BACL|nr:glutamate-1-semialdehyde 2,1-aminomutase [Paenibacillus nasutitermitis]GGD99182.1 glutamate-1-semialdehyde-2,1-aminomutase [Paenibacillus nasutitermitis]